MSTSNIYIEQTAPLLGQSIMTDEYQHEVRCGLCSRELYVDDEGYRRYTDALIYGLENPFRCEICNEE